MQSLDVFFDLRLNKWFSSQSRHRWFETPSRWSWCHCHDEKEAYLRLLHWRCSSNSGGSMRDQPRPKYLHLRRKVLLHLYASLTNPLAIAIYFMEYVLPTNRNCLKYRTTLLNVLSIRTLQSLVFISHGRQKIFHDMNKILPLSFW